MFDSHCHWDHPRLQALQPDLWNSCLQQGVTELLVPGTQATSWQQQIDLCTTNPHWHLSLGLHPYFLDNYQAQHNEQLHALVRQHKPVAIGEIGLDWALPQDTWALQERVFLQQLQLSKDMDLPVILHVRKCHDRVIKLIRQTGFAKGGIVHAYSGNQAQAASYATLRFKLGVGGTITYPRASKTRQLFSSLPLQWLVLETDAPDMPMVHQQDRLNRPDHLPKVLEVLAELRTESVAKLVQQTRANTFTVLRLPQIAE